MDTRLSECWRVHQKQIGPALDMIDRLKNDPGTIGPEVLIKAFSQDSKPRYLVACPDGRIKRGKIGIIGSGVFQSDEEIAITAHKIRLRYPDQEIRVSYHEFCAAARIKAEELFNSGSRDVSAEDVATWAADRLALLLRAGKAVKVGYLPDSRYAMCGFHDIHHEGMIILAGTDFSPRALGFPVAFYHSIWCAPNDRYIENEFKIALDIALGKYGFGRTRFRDNFKLPIVVVGHPTDPDCSVGRYESLIAPLLKSPDYAEHVQLLSFTKPDL